MRFISYLAETKKIADNSMYLANMAKSFGDKAWFLRYIAPDVQTIVDFGGSAGEFCRYVDSILSPRGRKMHYVIIDNNPDFAAEAAASGFTTFSSLKEFMAAGGCDTSLAVLVMSSVIHEIYSYQDENGPASLFWKDVDACGFRQIAVRDMSICERAYRDAPVRDILWVYQNILRSGLEVKGVPLIEQTESFEERWGAICDVAAEKVDIKRLIHFLVKYRYAENWDREVNEDYLPVSQDRLEAIFRSMGYRFSHKESSKLDFYARRWAKDFRLARPDNGGHKAAFLAWLKTLSTHIKWMAEK